VEERGSAYLPQVNAFYVREFQMMHAAENAARFLHHACRGLPEWANGHENAAASGSFRIDHFYTRVIEHAVAYFGSRILYPSRSAPESVDSEPLSRAACERMAQAAVHGDESKMESSVRELGYRIGCQIYDAYLAGKVAPGSLRRLFLAHLDKPGLARKVVTAVLAKLRSISRPMARAAHA
jgi:hypothetical protein